MTISAEDRATSQAAINNIEERVRKSQISKVLGRSAEPDGFLRLGRYVRKWQTSESPSKKCPTCQSVVFWKVDECPNCGSDLSLDTSDGLSEPNNDRLPIRSARSKASAVKKHGHRIAAALVGTPSAPALATAMVDTAQEAIGNPSSVQVGSQVGQLLTDIPSWADHIITSMQANGDEPLDVADRVANDVAVSADSASALDEISSDGGTGWTFQAEGSPCSVCAALDGQTFAIDDTDNLPPVHGSCGCSVVPK